MVIIENMVSTYATGARRNGNETHGKDLAKQIGLRRLISVVSLFDTSNHSFWRMKLPENCAANMKSPEDIRMGRQLRHW